MRTVILSTVIWAISGLTVAGQHLHAPNRAIEFPDVPGYQTLVCDFHTHTVFSDGHVWPTIRVQEAIRDGLDCVAITDHLEYQPHADDIPHPDRNRSYQVALEEAEGTDLIVVRGSEITRDMPPGHSNAVFLENANPLLQDDVVEVFRAATAQGAFNFWNHPNWTAQRADGVATLTDLHRRLIDEGLLHGIEVVNDVTYSDEALQIALDNDLTLIGTSDIHGLIDWAYEVPQGGHRPVTLVFAEERSRDGIKAALEAGRTAVWFNNLLIGREEQVLELVASAIDVTSAQYGEDTTVLEVEIQNASDVGFVLDSRSGFTFHQRSDLVMLPPQESTTLYVKTVDRLSSATLSFEVMNVVTAPNTHPDITLTFPVTE